VKSHNKRGLVTHREERLAARRAWYEKHRERLIKQSVKRQAERLSRGIPRAKRLSYYRLYIRQRPPWADMKAIEAVYMEAARLTRETGVIHHVDHIIPLRGRSVSGLHVETNLRPLPKEENQRKHAKFEPG
jgi:hypothetical protein